MSRALVFGLLALTACAPAAGPGTAAADSPDAGEKSPAMALERGPDIRLSDSTAGLDEENGTEVDLRHARDLYVRLIVPTMVSPSVVRLTLRSPTGEVFLTDSAPYSADPARTSFDAPGLDHVVTALPAKHDIAGFTIDRSIPIAGTLVQRFLSPGTWWIDASIEGGLVTSRAIVVTWEEGRP